MIFLTVKAKVPRVEEEQIGKDYREIEDPVYVWGPLGVRLDDIDTLWGQSLNRSVIAKYSGETILVAEPYASLLERIEKLAREQDTAESSGNQVDGEDDGENDENDDDEDEE